MQRSDINFAIMICNIVNSLFVADRCNHIRIIIENPTAFCHSPKTDTTTPGKLGRTVGFWTREGRGQFLDCPVTGLCRILPYCRFLHNSSMPRK